MKDTWQLSLKERLKRWRLLRSEVKELPSTSEKVTKVLDFWKSTPVSARAMDPYDNSTWLSPWELLEENVYDDNSISLMMAYTLQYSNTPTRLLLVQDVDNSEIKLIVLVDNKYVINYNYNTIDTLDSIGNVNILEDIDVTQLTK
jgi:hypothetical protein